jgi:hypothetical protein
MCVFEESLIYPLHPICRTMYLNTTFVGLYMILEKIQMYLMKYAHRNLLEVEKWSQFLEKILEDHPYLDLHHKTPETIPPTINKQSHEIDIKSKLLKHTFDPNLSMMQLNHEFFLFYSIPLLKPTRATHFNRHT